MFNLKYLPIAGILVRYSHGWIPNIIARAVEGFLQRNTGESFTPQEKSFVNIPKYTKDIYSKKLTEYLNKKKFVYEVREIFTFEAEESINAIENMVYVGDLMEGDLSKALVEFEKLDNPDNENKIFFEVFSEDEQIRYRASLLRRMLEKIIDVIEQGVNYIRWFIFMTNNEKDICDRITKKDENGASKYLHMMMDVDHFFNENTTNLKYISYFSFDKQVENMQQLNALNDNLIGFIAFNPAREGSLELVKKAIKEKGFKGVKFYPPMGYKAFGDLTYRNEIEELVKFCVDENVPLFTHCNNKGFEAWPGKKNPSGYNSNPIFWEQLLEKYNSLILCLGHAGGTEGWFSKNKPDDFTNPEEILASNIKDDEFEQKCNWNKSYASMVYKLCVKYNNVYCDASYLDDMVNSDGSFNPNARNNFKERLLKLFSSQSIFSKKIMYGSDWHMLFQEAKNAVYLNKYLEFFSDDEFDNYRDDFFYKNANLFLNAKSK